MLCILKESALSGDQRARGAASRAPLAPHPPCPTSPPRPPWSPPRGLSHSWPPLVATAAVGCREPRRSQTVLAARWLLPCSRERGAAAAGFVPAATALGTRQHRGGRQLHAPSRGRGVPHCSPLPNQGFFNLRFLWLCIVRLGLLFFLLLLLDNFFFSYLKSPKSGKFASSPHSKAYGSFEMVRM